MGKEGLHETARRAHQSTSKTLAAADGRAAQAVPHPLDSGRQGVSSYPDGLLPMPMSTLSLSPPEAVPIGHSCFSLAENERGQMIYFSNLGPFDSHDYERHAKPA